LDHGYQAHCRFDRYQVFASCSKRVANRARHVSGQVAEIRRGAKPGDLPIEQAHKFILVITLKNAKALGIAVPASVLALADEVIE
jgi:putative ABC transport system substrate-binding protein